MAHFRVASTRPKALPMADGQAIGKLALAAATQTRAGIGQAKEINLMLSAYPNPTAESVKLEIEDGNPEGFGYQLYDINGKLLESKKVVSNKTDIAMSSLLPATYFIKVTKGNEEIKVFKIIKK